MTTQLTVTYRPLRIGFVAQDGDVTALRRIAVFNSLLWGGVSNPIIPVGPNKGLAEQLVKLFNADILIPVGGGKEVKDFIEQYPYLSTITLRDDLLTEDWHTKKKNLTVLDVIHVIEHCWQTEFRHEPADFKSNCALVEWDRDDPNALTFSLLFGMFPDDLDLKEDFRKAFKNGLKAHTIRVDNGGPVPAELATIVPPLKFTLEQTTSFAGGLRESGIFVGDQTFGELIDFWNLRAAGIQLQFIPFQHVNRFDEFLSNYLERLDSQLGRFPGHLGEISLYYREDRAEPAEEIARGLNTKKPIVRCRSSDVLWNGLNIRPKWLRIGGGNALGHVYQTSSRYQVTFELPPRPFEPDDRRPLVGSQHYVAVVNPLGEYEYPNHTLKPPPLRTINEFLSREIAFDPWKVRTESDGLGLVVKLYDSAECLYPVEHQQLIIKVLDTVGLAAEPSPAGRLANQVILAMRETEPLEACRVFKIRGVRKLIKQLAIAGEVGWNEALAVIGREGFAKHKNLYIESRTARHLQPQDVLRFLLEKRVLRPKLRLWETITRKKKTFACKTCGLKSTIRTKRFEGVWQCPYCQAEHYLPAIIGSEFRRARNEWRLQRSGLFAKNNNQEGALPVILTLLQLKRRSSSLGSFLYSPGLDLKLDSGKECEVDLAVIEYGSRQGIELGIAECKDEGGTIDQRDVHNLLTVRAAFAHSDIKPHLIFAKTNDAFRPDEIALFKKLAADGVLPILLTNRELEPYDPYEEFRDEDLPAPYGGTLEEMAWNSKALYLRTE